jgi:CRP-like cAMP-binding protein
VEIAARLSKLPLFGRTSADELFRFAGTGQQARYEADRVLYAEGAMPDSLQFLLDGLVVATRHDGGTDERHPPAALGFDEVLQGVPMAATLRTADTCVCQVLSNDEARTLLADNTDLVSGLFGTMVDHPSFASRRALLKGGGDGDLARFAAEGVKPVEKALALQRLDIFARFPTAVLVELANIARAVAFKAGDTLAGEGDAPAIFFVLTGMLALESSREPALHADAGDAVGAYETLANQRLGRSVRGIQDGAVLRIPADDLFDLLGQRPDVLRHFFAALLGTQERATVA